MNWREASRSRLPVAPAIPDKWSAAVCNRPDRPAPGECVRGQAIAALAGARTAKRSCRRSSPTIAIRHRPPRSYRRRGIEMSPKQRRLPRRPNTKALVGSRARLRPETSALGSCAWHSPPSASRARSSLARLPVLVVRGGGLLCRIGPAGCTGRINPDASGGGARPDCGRDVQKGETGGGLTSSMQWRSSFELTGRSVSVRVPCGTVCLAFCVGSLYDGQLALGKCHAPGNAGKGLIPRPLFRSGILPSP
jgi:hypothetical protein